ncbi:MAG: beta-lactamase family protein, partial [Acidimicrobiia bacterium]|nr:beta-lactamase family protein [Acidimicrobiia bacterium]
HRRPADEAPWTDDTIVRIYSMTKPITSLALLTLYEEGRFRLNEPVSNFIPSWSGLRVFAGGTAANHTTRFPEREVTIHDLLTHTSGLTYSWTADHPVEKLYRKHGIDGDLPLETYVEALAQVPLLFSPGTRWSYSVATDVIGRLIEIISGRTFDRFLQERFFEPLGMVDTGFQVPDETADRFAACYALPSASPIPLRTGSDGDHMAVVDDAGPTSRFRAGRSFLSGGGGLVSTLDDYLRFCLMLNNGGELDGVRILSRKTIEYATRNHLPDGRDLVAMGARADTVDRDEGLGFGLGFSVVIDPSANQVISSVGEYAWGGAASTVFWIDPAEDLIVIAYTQLLPSEAYPIRAQLKSLIYGAVVD